MSKEHSPYARRGPSPFWQDYLAYLALLLLFLAGVLYFSHSGKPAETFEAPDDILAARELPAQKFTGPAYFQLDGDTTPAPFPSIPVPAARMQLERIVRERALAPAAAAELSQLIHKLTIKASPAGAALDHVNALQLNLALDRLR